MTDFQASAGIQGRQFAEQCSQLLMHYGYALHGRTLLTTVGVEVDCVATSPGGNLVWFEFKGSVQGSRTGSSKDRHPKEGDSEWGTYRRRRGPTSLRGPNISPSGRLSLASLKGPGRCQKHGTTSRPHRPADAMISAAKEGVK